MKRCILLIQIIVTVFAYFAPVKAEKPGIEEYEQEVAREIISAIKTNNHMALVKYFEPTIGTRISLQLLGDYGIYNDYGGYSEKNGNLYILLFDTKQLNSIQRVANALSFMDAFNKDDKVQGYFPKDTDNYKIAPTITMSIEKNYYYIILSLIHI